MLLFAFWLTRAAVCVALGLVASIVFGADFWMVSISSYVLISLIFATIDLFDQNTKKKTGGPCPYCGGRLRTPKAKQCPHCFRKWHNQTTEAAEESNAD